MLTWALAEKDFRAYLLTAGMSSETARTYGYNLRSFARWCGEQGIIYDDVRRTDVRLWLLERREVADQNRCANELTTVKCFYTWLIEEERQLTDNPAASLKLKREDALPTRPLSEDQLRQLFAYAPMNEIACCLPCWRAPASESPRLRVCAPRT